MRLSKNAAELARALPRQFQHTYLDQLSSPASPEQQERQTWKPLSPADARTGLANRVPCSAGYPVAKLDDSLCQCSTWFWPLTQIANIPRKWTLLHKFRIICWRLFMICWLQIIGKPKSRLENLSQTSKPVLVRTELADTSLSLCVGWNSDYQPEQISMTYWFVQSLDQPQSLKFTYNTQHHQTGQKLHRLLSHLTDWLQRYQEESHFRK